MSTNPRHTGSVASADCLKCFHPAVQTWFGSAFDAPTPAQSLAWPKISGGANTLLLAPTGSGKTLSAFLVAIDRMMFPQGGRVAAEGVKTLYISPLKALGVDVERNLRSPLFGIQAIAERDNHSFCLPSVGIRSGDTPPAERHRMSRQPPDILITTPESLFLLLTSQARRILPTIDTLIIDEIHSMVSTKRGSHLFLSLERLESLRQEQRPNAPRLQRIGLSATQRPLEEVARLLGGCEAVDDPGQRPVPRPVEIVQAGKRKPMQLTIEVPVEDMASLTDKNIQTGPAAAAPGIPSIWPSIYPRLVELIGKHRSTMIFVNSRRLAERMAAAINETADQEIALAHHGSIARDARLLIEDRLKRGTLPAIVATSSLELGIDMGAVDLVIQIESPPTIAAGIQRIGRAGHQVGTPSKGVIFPKYRGDLLACSAAVERMLTGEVEESFFPRNPLDVLAQQIVAMVALEPRSTDELYRTVRSAAPFAELTRGLFESVLDLLAGRYPSDEFAELRARVNWDRVTNLVSPRRGTQRLAIANAGTIPDRGLYGVFLAGDGQSSSRVGELDEEMVFETNPGEVFLLGASSWRVLDITHERVVVEPAPGQPGRMPFWRGDGPGRPLEFGQAIGRLTRELVEMKADSARERLQDQHALDSRAAFNLMNYLQEQVEATGEAPSDRTIVMESFLDEIGDWRVVLLTPFGTRIHAPWATAVAARLRSDLTGELDMFWSDDGIVFRMPESEPPPDPAVFFPTSAEIEEIVVRELGGTALFAARFRENAARALLLPRRQPGRRTPLWLQRRRSADLLQVASRYEKFPIMLETFRECLRDVFDLRGLRQILDDVANRRIRVRSVQTSSPSPFAAALMFNYTGNFIYNGDSPLAERRAAALALDHVQLRELLGDAEMRELLDSTVIDELTLELPRRHERYTLRDGDSIHDLLRYVGDLSQAEIGTYPHEELDLSGLLEGLEAGRRIVQVGIGEERRWIAAEDAGRYRDALGCVAPPGLPAAFLDRVDDPLGDLVSRYARTHVPFLATDVAARFRIGVAPVLDALQRLQAAGRVVEGEFLPGGRGREWCDVEVLRRLKRRSLARLRAEIEPVEPSRYASFLLQWQGLERPRRGLDGLLDVIEQLQGLALPFSEWERSIFPARLMDYQCNHLDELCASGEVVWRGCSAVGSTDGRVAFYLTDAAPLLSPQTVVTEDESERMIFDFLAKGGAQFFQAIVTATGGFPNDVLDRLWRLVWAGHITNDTLAPLRSRHRQAATKNRRSGGRRRMAFRSRRASRLAGSEGRWAVFRPAEGPTATERQTALACQLIERYGVLTREAVAAEGIVGGFAGLYPVLKAMEESGRVRRGYFVAGQGAAQFAAPGAEDRLRDTRQRGNDRESTTVILAATDPANPYGASLPWPSSTAEGGRPQRSSGSQVVLADGVLLGYLSRGGQRLRTFLPETEPARTMSQQALVQALVESARHDTVYLQEIDGTTPESSSLATLLRENGFLSYGGGFQRKAASLPANRSASR